MKPIHDEQQRQQALDISLSFIVQAPAGSGKTELLTQRYLALLPYVKQPEEIIAITFTKKSSSEMRARIINALSMAAEQPEPELAHAKKTWHLAKHALQQSDKLNWNLLQNPNRLRIQTIDSFNTYITKQLPILSHFGAPPSITDDYYKLYEEAVCEFLSHLEENVAWSASIAQLLTHLDNDLNKVKELLINMLAKRDQWLPYITLNAYEEDLRDTLESNLESITCDILTTLIAHFPKDVIEELLFLIRYAAQHLSSEQSSSFIVKCLDLTALPTHKAHDKPYWLGIAEFLLTKEFEWRKRFDKTLGFPAPSATSNPEEKSLFAQQKHRMSELIQKLSNHEELKLALTNLCLSPECQYQDNQWETLQELHQVLRIAVAQLKLTFQQHGTIDYIENAQAALTALGNDDSPTDMTLALDYQIKHLLIDEFQDTSQSQFRLIEKLTAGWENQDGRTLFLVGDPMQSIYRFREAEVGLFIRARKNGLGHIKLIPLTLSVNFRSVPDIVEWVNNHFAKIFPTFEDIAMGAVRYSISQAHADYSEKNTRQVTLNPIPEAHDTKQADAIIELINTCKSKRPHDSIAILVRSRSHLAAIIPALKKAHLSYRAIDIDPLDTKPVIQDLMALTRALLHPADRIAWLAILRAPWCGLSLSDLFKLSNSYPHASLWDRLQSSAVIKSLSADAQQRLGRIMPVLKNTIADRHRYALRFWLENCWLALGGPATVANKADLQDANSYFALIDKLDAGGYLVNLDHLQKHVSQLFAAPNHQADNTLQIMTIHNSKGLEFDTVILPHLERKSPNDDKQLLLWMEQPQQNDTSALILAPIHAIGQKNDTIYDYIKRQHSIKNDYETARLLYVAATRAKKQLHLFFSLESTPASGSLLEKLWPAIKQEISLAPRQPADATVAYTPAAPRLIQRLTPSWQNPIASSTATDIAYQHKLGFKLPNDQAKHLGTVIHELLQYIGQLGIGWWQDKAAPIKYTFLEKRFTQLGTYASDIHRMIEKAMLAIENTLSDARGLWIMQNHLQAASELKLTAHLDGQIQSFIVDRTFVEHNTRWIIDFKSSSPDTENLTAFLDQEAIIYQEQLRSYEQALRAMDNKPIKLGLYFPLIPAWREL